jgi:hypothetical protein
VNILQSLLVSAAVLLFEFAIKKLIIRTGFLALA